MDEDTVDAMIGRSAGSLVMGLLGFGLGFGMFALMATAYVGGALLIGWGISSVVPALAGFPVFPTVMMLTGAVLLILDVIYVVFRPKKLRDTMLALYAQAPKDWNTTEVHENLSPRQAEAMMVASVRGMIFGFMAVMLVFESFYAAAVSWGFQESQSGLSLFEDMENPNLLAHFVFWLGVPFDLFLLDAPSLFGFPLSDLEPDRTTTVFLFGIFLFKTVLVANVVRLIFELVTFKSPKTETIGSKA